MNAEFTFTHDDLEFLEEAISRAEWSEQWNDKDLAHWDARKDIVASKIEELKKELL